MKTIEIEANGHDLRKGFETIEYANKEEEKQIQRRENYEADLARRRRLRKKSTKPRMSFVLIRTKIPQVFDKFIMPNSRKACALGALHLECGGNKYNDSPDWWRIEHNFDVTDEELRRNVDCPRCIFKNRNSLASQIHHLNDVHKASNKEIGLWLKKFDL